MHFFVQLLIIEALLQVSFVMQIIKWKVFMSVTHSYTKSPGGNQHGMPASVLKADIFISLVHFTNYCTGVTCGSTPIN